MKGHILEYTNDFAQWAGESMEERVLAEYLSNIDPYDFGTIDGLRSKLLSVIDEGGKRFFAITNRMHNALQGSTEVFTEEMWRHYADRNRINAERPDLEADAVIVHDPQPASLIEFRKRGVWLWRCHIDMSNPVPCAYEDLQQYAKRYDAAIFPVARFARATAASEYIIAPAIDSFSEKNRKLEENDVRETSWH